MTSERIRPSEKTISWNSNPGLGNEATSQGSVFHFSKCLHISPSHWIWTLGRKSCGQLNCISLALSTGIVTQLGMNTQFLKQWMNARHQSRRVRIFWSQRQEKAVFLIPSRPDKISWTRLCVLWRPKTAVLHRNHYNCHVGSCVK